MFVSRVFNRAGIVFVCGQSVEVAAGTDQFDWPEAAAVCSVPSQRFSWQAL